MFKTKPKIAAELIGNFEKTNLFPAKWVGADATFGSDWEFLDSLQYPFLTISERP